MRIVTCSDAHLDVTTHGVPRFDEVAGALEQVVSYAIGQRADCFFFLGDASDPDSGAVVFRAVEVLARAALRLHAAGIPSVWLQGNHDVAGDGAGTSVLTPLRALAAHLDGVYVVDEPRVFRPRGLFTLACLPFTEPSRKYDPEKAIPEEGCDVIIGHLTLPGILEGSEVDMRRGRDEDFPSARAVSKARLVLHGHHHHRQRTPEGIWVSGSLARLRFGEETVTPSFLDLELT